MDIVEIIKSNTEPDKNKLWLKEGTLKRFGNNGWEDITGANQENLLEFENKDAFPMEGKDGEIYVALDTNLIYKWSGSTYVEISPSIALGETSSTAYAGDKGKHLKDVIDSLPSTIKTTEGPGNVHQDANAVSIASNTYIRDSDGTYKYNTEGESDNELIINSATSENAGVMSAEDKQKLDKAYYMAKPYLNIESERPLEVGDIIFVSSIVGRVFATKIDDEALKAESAKIIGVVVTPQSHNIYGDGTVGIVSVTYATEDGEGSETEIGLPIGPTGFGYTTGYYHWLPCVGTNTITPNNTIVVSKEAAWLAVDSPDSTRTKSPVCSWLNYPKTIQSVNGYLPTFYLEDGSFNPVVVNNSEVQEYSNGLNDFKGREEFYDFIQQIPYNNLSQYKGIVGTLKHHVTSADKPGQWYIPGIGELCYLATRFYYFKSLFDKLNEIKGTNYQFTDAWLFSISNFSWAANNVRTIMPKSGYVSFYETYTNGFCIRPFIRGKSVTYNTLDTITEILPEATVNSNGVMSSDDKCYLEDFKSIGSNLGFTADIDNAVSSENGVTVNYTNYIPEGGSTTTTDATFTIPLATTTSNGIMSKDDKTKLGSIKDENTEYIIDLLRQNLNIFTSTIANVTLSDKTFRGAIPIHFTSYTGRTIAINSDIQKKEFKNHKLDLNVNDLYIKLHNGNTVYIELDRLNSGSVISTLSDSFTRSYDSTLEVYYKYNNKYYLINEYKCDLYKLNGNIFNDTNYAPVTDNTIIENSTNSFKLDSNPTYNFVWDVYNSVLSSEDTEIKDIQYYVSEYEKNSTTVRRLDYIYRSKENININKTITIKLKDLRNTLVKNGVVTTTEKDYTLTLKSVALSNIELTCANTAINVGSIQTLELTGSPDNHTKQHLLDSAIFETSTPDIIQLLPQQEKGKIKFYAIKSGTAKVSALIEVENGTPLYTEWTSEITIPSDDTGSESEVDLNE